MTNMTQGRAARVLGVILLLACSASNVAWPKEMSIHILWEARVKDVQCHALQNEGHDYALGGSATVVGRDGRSGKTRTIVAEIVVSRLQEIRAAEADSVFLCQQLTDMKRSGAAADILFSVVRSNAAQPRNAIRAITRLRGCDENDRAGSGE